MASPRDLAASMQAELNPMVPFWELEIMGDLAPAPLTRIKNCARQKLAIRAKIFELKPLIDPERLS